MKVNIMVSKSKLAKNHVDHIHINQQRTRSVENSSIQRPVVKGAERVKIVQRYSKIRFPTIDDKVNFAEALGVSISTLGALRTRLLRHGGSALLPAKRTTVTYDAIKQAIASAEEPDLRGIMLARQAEIRRKIAIIGKYLEGWVRGQGSLTQAAKEYGVSAETFGHIAQKWIKHRDPTRIPGALRSQVPRHHLARTNPEAERMITGFIDLYANRLSVRELHRLIATEFEARGLKAPAISTVRQRITSLSCGTRRSE